MARHHPTPGRIVLTVTIHIGDVFTEMAKLDDDSVDCAVFSPPYWGLRDYGVAGQIGLESTLAEHLEVMVAVLEEVKRILKPAGTCWLNYGDCYAAAPNGRSAADTKSAGKDDRTFRDKPFSTVGPISKSKRIKRGSGRWGGGNNPSGPICAEGQPSTVTRGSNSGNKQSSPPSKMRIYAGGFLKAKDLCMIPNRLAIALQDAGWWVRSEIIWAKPNPMPESIKDRPSTSHEKIWLLTKSAKYYYDHEAVRMARVSDGAYKTPDGWDTGKGAHGTIHRRGRSKGETAKQRIDKQRGHGRRHAGFNDRWDKMTRPTAAVCAIMNLPRWRSGILPPGLSNRPILPHFRPSLPNAVSRRGARAVVPFLTRLQGQAQPAWWRTGCSATPS